MYIVFLNKLKLYGYHGWHQEETILGGEFEISVNIHFELDKPVLELSDTIDYVTAYKSIKTVFSVPTPLLETLAKNICDSIATGNNLAKKITVSITKLNTPIINFEGEMGVTYVGEF